MTYLLDTNACIRHLRQRDSTISSRLASVEAGSVVLCSIVVAELLFGAQRSKNVLANMQMVTQFCAGFVSLPFDDAAARGYATIRAAVEAVGTPIGPNDLLIAAIAVSAGLTLVTHNTREFQRVPNLAVEDWQ
jgi:tRNA(fMet)-specific endonuclease VapC